MTCVHCGEGDCCVCSPQPQSAGPEHELISRWNQTPLGQMSTVGRYSSFPVHHVENVAEHSYYVMFYAWVVARHIKEMKGERFDWEALLEKGMFHDLDESVTGDIIRSFKHYDPHLKKHMDRVSEHVITDAYADMPGGGPTILHHWKYSKDDSPEGNIVDFADVWAVYIYLRREIELGNKWARDHCSQLHRRIMHTAWPVITHQYAMALALVIKEEVGSEYISRTTPGD